MFPPPNSCDCHVHVIGPKGRFPLPANRRYTPSDATAAELAAMLKRLGMARVVIVQPSFYGTDNACTLDGIAQLGNARGIAVLPPTLPAERARHVARARHPRPAHQHRHHGRRADRQHQGQDHRRR